MSHQPDSFIPNSKNYAPIASLTESALLPARLRALLPYVILIGVFIFFGLTGHDPWKADEAYVFGVIHTMLTTGDWLVPTVAGEPFMEKPPLYYWFAAAMVRLLSGWVAAPDAARLTSGIFMAITCGAVAAAAHAWWGKGTGRWAPLMLLACLGGLNQTHMMMPDVPLLTGFALSAWGFSRVLATPLSGGILIGLGIGISFLSKGIFGPGVMGLTCIALPACFGPWRRMAYVRGIAIAFLVSLPFLLIWPIALYVKAPAEFTMWFWDNNFGRFLGLSVVANGTEHQPGFWRETLPWFTFPALPLAAYVLWQKRQVILSHSGIQFALIAFSMKMLILATSSSARTVYALPLLVPLAIMAAPSVYMLPKLADKLWSRGSQILFGILAGTIWLGWIIMMTTGSPPQWPWLLRVMPADFIAKFDGLTFVTALLLSVGAVLSLRFFSTLPGKGLSSWMTGLTLAWALLSTLWMPWLDHGKSYRKVFSEMPLSKSTNCVASMGLGESERAMLEYVAGQITVRREILPHSLCTMLLLQGYVPIGNKEIDPRDWELIWDGARPGDTWQRFWLFRSKRQIDSENQPIAHADERLRPAGP